jgi:hypothetical protein
MTGAWSALLTPIPPMHDWVGSFNKKVICYLTSSGSQKIKIWLPCLIGKFEMLDELNIEYNDPSHFIFNLSGF